MLPSRRHLHILHSHILPGFWLDPAWLWEAEPDALRALAAIVGTGRLAEVLQSDAA